MSSEKVRRAVEIVVVFAAYVATARLGLSFDALSGIATTVWPPTGIALAALVLRGLRLWPVVAAASVVVNVASGLPVWGAAIVAVGNTLEAVIGASVMARFGFDSRLGRLRDVLLLVGVAALGSTVVSASFGLVAVAVAGVHPADSYPAFWAVWWVGDAMGDLIVAPLILVWAAETRLSRRPWRWAEGALLGVALAAMSLLVFQRVVSSRAIELIRGTYAIVPLLVWAALRFEQRGVTASLVLVAAMAVVAASSPTSVFAAPSQHEQLLMIQAYMAVTAISMLTLGAALAERRSAIRARDEFISIASHELKTPLTALKLRLDAAAKLGNQANGNQAEAGEGTVVDKRARAISAARSTTDRLVGLVDNLLDVSRVHAGRLVLQLEPVSVADMVNDVVARLKDQATEIGSTITADVPGNLVGIWDRSRMEQVVTNLLTNALKYGKGRPISISGGATDGRFELKVKDAGMGISRADQSRIFRAFERVVTGGRVGGLGLGLYIGQQIAAAHGGTLSVDSEPERGATFTLAVPLVPNGG